MTRPRALALAGAFLASLALSLAAWGDASTDPVAVPKLTAHVTDQTGTLSAAERDALDAKLAGFEKERGSQVAVLIVPTIGSEAVEEYAGRVTDAWKLGRKGVDDGVLFLVAKQERKIRIQTGRGVQGTLTDALSRRIASDIVAAKFRTGDFAGGLNDGADAIMKAIAGEQLAMPEPRTQAHTGKVDSGFGGYSNLLVFALLLVPIAGMVLRGIFGRFIGATATAGVTAFAAWAILGSLVIVVIAALGAFVFTLLSGMGGGRGMLPGGFFPGGGMSGGSWGGGGSSGGGGFSGGGGGFDGGGASGSW